MPDFVLPQKTMSGLRRLFRHYNKKGEVLLSKIIETGHIFVETGTDYDNWNDGIYGHDLHIFVPTDVIDMVDLKEQDNLFEKLKGDISQASPRIENEYIRKVFVQEIDELDNQYQASIPFSKEPKASPDNVGIWNGNALRLFISHRDKHKSVARELSDSLTPYGVSAFVAHHTIKPMREWQKEIMNGLITMEVMLVLLTDDFHESEWTNQEVGYALGKGIPIICVKVGEIDPKGFIASRQALKANYKKIYEAAPFIQRTLINEIGQEARLKEILINAFISSISYNDAMENLKRLNDTIDKLTDNEFSRIVEGYEKNDQLYTCNGIHNRRNWFKRYLESATGKELIFKGNKITESTQKNIEEIPF